MDHHLPIVGTLSREGRDAATLGLRWADETATQHCAQALASLPALRNAFLTLHGDLGAGKTTFARHLLQALGVSGRIKSPTYAIVETYETALGPIAHCDFYRFNDPQEWEDAGFRDIFASPGLKLVEWPQKAQGLLPRADLDLHIRTLADSAREVTLTPHTAQGQALVQGMAQWTPGGAAP